MRPVAEKRFCPFFPSLVSSVETLHPSCAQYMSDRTTSTTSACSLVPKEPASPTGTELRSRGVCGAQQMPGKVPRVRKLVVSERGAAPALTKLFAEGVSCFRRCSFWACVCLLPICPMDVPCIPSTHKGLSSAGQRWPSSRSGQWAVGRPAAPGPPRDLTSPVGAGREDLGWRERILQ